MFSSELLHRRNCPFLSDKQCHRQARRYWTSGASRSNTPTARMTRTAQQNIAGFDELERFVRQSSEDSDALFRAVADAAPVMLWMAGADARCTFVNRRWLGFTGRTTAQELGSGWMEGIHADDLAGVRERIVVARRTRRPLTIEYRLRRA